MSGTSNFQQFDPPYTNALSDAAYTASSIRTGGAPVGSLLPSDLFNKIIYQLSTFVTAFAGAMAIKGYNLSDANLATLQAVFGNVRTNNDVQILIQTVTYSPTPVFNAALGIIFDITLTGNVTSSTLNGFSPGQVLTFIIRQNSGGGNTFVWPSNVVSPPNILTTANARNVVSFIVGQSGDVLPFTPLAVS